MLVLFDFENIQNVHYRSVKQLLIKEFGSSDWNKAIKVGAVSKKSEPMCLKDWNSNVRIYRVSDYPQAADDKLVEIAVRTKGNRCIIISNDNILFDRVKAARIELRKKYLSPRGVTKTRTYRISFIDGTLTLQNG